MPEHIDSKSVVRALGFSLFPLYYFQALLYSYLNQRIEEVIRVEKIGVIVARKAIGFSFCSLFLFVSFAQAQVTGSISGTVLDSSGAPVPNATVNLTRSGDKTPLISSQTTSDGTFSFPSVAPLTYGISIIATAGSLSESDVAVRPGQPTVLRNLVLLADPAAAQITTRAEESVQTTDSQIASTLEIPQLELLPQSLRDPLKLLDTQAGVYTNNGTSTIDGIRPGMVNVTIDGVNAQDLPNRTGTLNYLPSRPFLDQVAEFSLVTSNQASRMGFGAAQVAFATPSGEAREGAGSSGQNNLHGDLFYLISPGVANSGEWFNNASANASGGYSGQTNFLRNQGGASLGGALKKDKLFFYLNYELLRYKDQDPARVNNLTSKGEALLAATSSISPSTLSSLVGALPIANITPTSDPDFGYAVANETFAQNLDNITGKLDLFVSGENSFSFSYLLSHDRSDPFFGTDPPQSTSALGQPTSSRSNDWRSLGALSWTKRSAYWVNEARVGLSDLPVRYEPRGGFPTKAELQLTYVGPYAYIVGNGNDVGETCFFASCNSGQAIGAVVNPLASAPPDSGGISDYRFSRSINAGDSVSVHHGKQSIQFGFQLQSLRDAMQSQFTWPSLDFLITPGNTDPLGTNGEPHETVELLKNGGLGPEIPYRFAQSSYAFYGQDVVRFSPKFTAVLGLRYELNPAPHEIDGQFLAPQLTAGEGIGSALLNPTTPYNFTGGPLFRSRYDNLAPNLGFAFDPTGKGTTVVRGGYGISYGNDDLLTALSSAQPQPQGYNGTTPLNGATYEANEYPNFNFSALPAQSGLTTSINAKTLQALYYNANNLGSGQYPVGLPGFGNAISMGGVDPNLRTPYVQQWNFDIQHAWHGTVFDLRYVGNHAVGLLRTVNINQLNLNGKDQNGNSFLADFLKGAPTGTTLAANCQNALVNNVVRQVPTCSSLFNLNYAGAAAAIYGEPTEYFQPGPAYNPASSQVYSIYANPYAQAGVNLLGNFSHSNYNALQIDVNHRLSSSLQFQLNYTFGKVLSSSASPTAGDTSVTKVEYFRSSANPKLDYGPADFDIRHALKVNFYYSIPRFQNLNGFGSQVLNGWSASSIVVVQSGTPFSIASNSWTNDFNGFTPVFTTVDLASGVNSSSLVGFHKTPCGVFLLASLNCSNTSATGGFKTLLGSLFAPMSAGDVGAVQPRSFYNPWASEVNLGIEKTFRSPNTKPSRFVWKQKIFSITRAGTQLTIAFQRL